MAKSTRKYTLETRAARVRLKVRDHAHWVPIGKGLALGYRKGKKAGAWVVRIATDGHHGTGARKYTLHTLDVKPDDYEDADGRYVLDYFQAQERARQFAIGERKKEFTGDINPEQYTVAAAMDDYLQDYEVRSGRDTENLTYKIEKHIRPKLGKVEVSRLTIQQVRRWRNNLVKLDTDDPEALRKRRVTANNILTTLKAALNFAKREGRALDDSAWRGVQSIREVDAPKVRFLDLHEVKRLINACDPDFRQLVRAALLTGCRYGELVRMTPADFDSVSGTVHIPHTKSGKGRHVPLTKEGQLFFRDAVVGLLGSDLIFGKADGEPWRKNHQQRRMREACERARIAPRISFHILRHCYGAALARASVSLQVIATVLGHSDTRMTERHYAHLCPSHVADVIRANLPNIGIESSNVVGTDR